MKGRPSMTEQELRSLPVVVNMETAGRAFSMGRTKAFELARRGEFPVPVMTVGRFFKVKRSDLIRMLLDDDAPSAEAS